MQRKVVMREIRAHFSNGDASSCISGDESIALFHTSSFDRSHQPTMPLSRVENLNNGKLRVLVVDDSRLNRKMLIKCFTSDGKRDANFYYDYNLY